MEKNMREYVGREAVEASADKTVRYKLEAADAEAIATGQKPFEVHGRRVACAEIIPGDLSDRSVTVRGIATVEAVEQILVADQRPDEVEKVAQLDISEPSRAERVFARFFGKQPRYTADFSLREPYAGELDTLREQ